MSGWRKQPIGDLPLYQAKTMAWLPRITQGFTTRRGGVSAAPYDLLNLGAHVGDLPASVQANRQRVWTDLGFAEAQVALAEQVHGDRISVVDPTRKVIGLAHAGWRGAAANIAGKTMALMTEEFGCLPSTCFAAIGPSIGGESYEVGAEVADQFRTLPGTRGTSVVTPRNEFTGTYSLNLRQIVFGQLLTAGLPAGAIAVCDEDTLRNKRDFFSYRRDGTTGRMAAFLGMKETKAG